MLGFASELMEIFRKFLRNFIIEDTLFNISISAKIIDFALKAAETTNL